MIDFFVCFLHIGMGSMPNLSIGLSSMSAVSAMPILTPIPVNPPMPSMQPLLPTPVTLPFIAPLGNCGLHNGTLLTPPLVPNNAGWFCSGNHSGQNKIDNDQWISSSNEPKSEHRLKILSHAPEPFHFILLNDDISVTHINVILFTSK